MVVAGEEVIDCWKSLYWSNPLARSVSNESSALCSILDMGGVFSWCSFFW